MMMDALKHNVENTFAELALLCYVVGACGWLARRWEGWQREAVTCICIWMALRFYYSPDFHLLWAVSVPIVMPLGAESSAMLCRKDKKK